MSNEKKVGRPILNDTDEKKQQAYEKNKDLTNKRIKIKNDRLKEKNQEKINKLKELFPNSYIKATVKGITIQIINSDLEKF